MPNSRHSGEDRRGTWFASKEQLFYGESYQTKAPPRGWGRGLQTGEWRPALFVVEVMPQIRLRDVPGCLGEDGAQGTLRHRVVVGDDKRFVPAWHHTAHLEVLCPADADEPEASEDINHLLAGEDFKPSPHTTVGIPRNWSEWTAWRRSRETKDRFPQNKVLPRRGCAPCRRAEPPARTGWPALTASTAGRKRYPRYGTVAARAPSLRHPIPDVEKGRAAECRPPMARYY